eukprot:gb/GEZJ01005770.1/.p1 GENE.gb/GEZJ01005770.1/~~gb/GEZJ01005770.1/.p1  ORF type:complete len:478 (+),score=53.02 gb/GEZJ01005770.1/:898-2331(+)
MVVPVFVKNHKIYDCHGWIRVRHALLSHRKSWYMKLLGSTLTLHDCIDKSVELEYSVTSCKIMGHLGGKSFTVKFSSGAALRIYCDSKPKAGRWKRALRRASALEFEYEFVLGNEIEQDGKSSVFNAVHRDNKTKHAVQRISKDPLLRNYAEQNRFLGRQIYALRTLRHPNILSASHIFNEDEHAYLVTAPVNGDRLRDVIAQNGGNLPEAAVRHVAKQLIPAVEYLHQRGFVHRNITTDTIWCDHSDQKKPKVVLSNFDLVHFVDDEEDQRMRDSAGDARYHAPEIVQGQAYNAAVDMFSVGVCLYRMLSGSFPFAIDPHRRHITVENRRNGPAFREECWKDISTEARSFLSSLLERSWVNRVSASDAIYHDWFSVELPNDVPPATAFSSDGAKEADTQRTAVSSLCGDKVQKIASIEKLAEENGVTLSPFLLRFLSPISSEVPISERSPVDVFASSLRQYMGSASLSSKCRQIEK